MNWYFYYPYSIKREDDVDGALLCVPLTPTRKKSLAPSELSAAESTVENHTTDGNMLGNRYQGAGAIKCKIDL